jgi:hypothetical protein
MMFNDVIPYLCYRLGVGTLPMVSLMVGELIVYLIFGRIVVVPVPFGIGTNGFKEIYDSVRTGPRREYPLLTAMQS